MKLRYQIQEWDGTFCYVNKYSLLGTTDCLIEYDDGTTHRVSEHYFWSIAQ